MNLVLLMIGSSFILNVFVILLIIVLKVFIVNFYNSFEGKNFIFFLLYGMTLLGDSFLI